VWRALGAGAYPQVDAEGWVVSGVRILHGYRAGEGRWKTFPFYYTVLALAEFDFPEVMAELRYACPVLKKVAVRTRTDSQAALRRKVLAERVLAKYG
jgi:hypothetical protein